VNTIGTLRKSLLAGLLAVSPLAPTGGAQETGEMETLVRRFAEVYSAVEAEAADPVVPYQAFFAGAIPGMLKRLDPHSVFFDPDHLEQLKQLQRATRKGFGSVVSLLPGRVFILQTIPGAPAERSGIAPGDEILAINGIALARLSIEQLVGLLSQARQSEVKLHVRRSGSPSLLEFTMAPASMESQSVDLFFTPRPGIGYVRAKSFEIDTGRRIKEAIDKLGGNELRGLILDLRGNRGGLMAAALDTAMLFLDPGQVIVGVRGRGTKTEEMKAPEDATPYRFPVAVLIDEDSASGSEIVAGALQDHDRGAVIGVPSFGKGLVQQVYELSEETGLALTTAYYYTPSGRSIQRPLHDGQLTGESAGDELEYRTDSGRTVRGGGGIRPDHLVYPEPMGRLRIVLEASGVFPAFATEAIRELGPVTEDLAVNSELLDQFQAWLAERNIQPSVSEWSPEREWIRSRLKQEIFNQTLGVDQGDQVELERDPRVVKALDLIAGN